MLFGLLLFMGFVGGIAPWKSRVLRFVWEPYSVNVSSSRGLLSVSRQLGEVRQGGERIGFEVVTLDDRTVFGYRRHNNALGCVMFVWCFVFLGDEMTLKHTSRPESRRWPSVEKYKVDMASFESLVLPELQVREDTDLFIIDKIGKMDLFSSSFFPAVLQVLESNIPILASIPIPKLGRDIPEVARLRNHSGEDIYTLSDSNRDVVGEEIRSLLVDLLRKH